jgi:hypothetical protein
MLIPIERAKSSFGHLYPRIMRLLMVHGTGLVALRREND